MTRQFLKIFAITVSTIGCSSSNGTNQNIDYIIYGIYCGECSGHCATMFKLDNNRLLIDTTDTFFKNSTNRERVIFKDDTLNKEQFQEAEIVRTSLPKILLQSKDKDFGNPDDHDQCGIYIQFKVDKQLKTFYIDTDLGKVPNELRDYAKLVMKVSEFKPL